MAVFPSIRLGKKIDQWQRGKEDVRMLGPSEQLKTNLKQNYSEKLKKFAISQQNAQFKKILLKAKFP